jgi:hypothetical protein
MADEKWNRVQVRDYVTKKKWKAKVLHEREIPSVERLDTVGPDDFGDDFDEHPGKGKAGKNGTGAADEVF